MVKPAAAAVLVALVAMPNAIALAAPAPSGRAKAAKKPAPAPSKPAPPRGAATLAGKRKPLKTKRYLDLTVLINRGRLRVIKVHRGAFKKPTVIRRFVGRFQVRLYTHKLLRDVVPFSFPLTLGAGERTPSNIQLGRALARGVRAQTKVRVPWRDDITRLLVVDRRRGTVVAVDLRKLRRPAPRLRPAADPRLRRTRIFHKR